MLTFLRHLMIAALAALASLSVPAAAAPLAAYGKLPAIETAVVSPNGKSVALITTNGEQRTIVVQDALTGQQQLRGFVGDHKVRNLQWAGDRHLVLVTSATQNSFDVMDGFREWFFGSVIDLDRKKLQPLMKNAEKADLNSIFGMPIVRNYHGEPSIFVEGIVFADGRGGLSLFRYDLATGVNRLVEQGSADTRGWVVDAEGRTLAQEVYNGGSGAWSLKLRTASGWREAATATGKLDRPYLVGLGRDNASVVYAGPGPDKAWTWHEVRADGGAEAQMPMADDQGVIRAALDGRMIGHTALVGDEARYTFFDPADQKAWKAIGESFAGQRVALESWSTDRQMVIVTVDSPDHGPLFALVNLAGRTATWLGAAYDGLNAADISPRAPIRFKAGDGLQLTGYLTTPQGRPAKGLPLIVFPHGGPAARDEPGFDWWAQAMASRGYAVLQVNFRGSDGLGDALLQAGYGQWGRRMQTDLSDGVRYLAAQGTIDPKRVCIVGGSYGGYAALAGATLDTGIYRCAVSVAGVADMRKMLAYSRGRGGSEAGRYWNRFMGVDAGGEEVLAQYSPAQQAAKADAPILLIHGKDDTVVPLEQSQIMADALKRAGKPVDLIIQPGADHWLSRGDTRLQMLTATMAFVEKHNPPN